MKTFGITFCFFVIFWATLSRAQHTVVVRDWFATSGDKITGTLIGVKDGLVTLKTPAGKPVTIKEKCLSEEDQNWIEFETNGITPGAEDQMNATEQNPILIRKSDFTVQQLERIFKTSISNNYVRYNGKVIATKTNRFDSDKRRWALDDYSAEEIREDTFVLERTRLKILQHLTGNRYLAQDMEGRSLFAVDMLTSKRYVDDEVARAITEDTGEVIEYMSVAGAKKTVRLKRQIEENKEYEKEPISFKEFLTSLDAGQKYLFLYDKQVSGQSNKVLRFLHRFK